jgi:uncharacterized protein
MRCAIAIFAKSPVRGAVKTRLCPPLTADQATELYRAFLLDTMHVISEVDGIEPGVLFTSGSGPSPSADSVPRRQWRGGMASTGVGEEITKRDQGLVPPDDARDDFRTLAPSHFFLVPQRGDGFGVRLANGFHDLFALGYEAAAIMDADSPTLPRAHIVELFERLSEPGCDVSVGPCDDGGYWAIGMKRLHPEVLTGITWSTELVLAQTLQRAQEAHLQAVCAPTWHDVDTGEALERLRLELTTPLPLAPARTIQALALLAAGTNLPAHLAACSASSAEVVPSPSPVRAAEDRPPAGEPYVR